MNQCLRNEDIIKGNVYFFIYVCFALKIIRNTNFN